MGKVGFEGDHLARGSGLRGRCGQDYVGKEVGMIIDLAHLEAHPELEPEFVLQGLPGAVTGFTGMESYHEAVRGGFLAHQKGGAAVTDVLLGEEGKGDGQRGQEEEKTFYSYGFSPKVMKNGE